MFHVIFQEIIPAACNYRRQIHGQTPISCQTVFVCIDSAEERIRKIANKMSCKWIVGTGDAASSDLHQKRMN